MIRRSILILPLLSLFAGGCFKFTQPSPQIHDYDLSYPPPALDRTPLEVSLGVPSLGITATYDREAIVYRTGENQIAKYFYHRWATNPADLIGDLLARDFSRSGLYHAVTHQRSPLAADYQLTGEIEAIEEVVAPDHCNASLAIRFLLVRQGTPRRNRVLLRPRFAVSLPTTCNKPVELAGTMSQALAQISTELQTQVYDAIAADTSASPG